MRGQHQSPRDQVRGLGAEILANDMETKIEPGRAARRCEDRTFIDVENVVHDLRVRARLCQSAHVMPMRGGAPPAQNIGRRQDERAGTDAEQSRSAGMGVTQRGDQGARHRSLRIAPPGNDDRRGHRQKLESTIRLDVDATETSQGTIFRGDDHAPIPARAHLRSGLPEDLDSATELEGAKPVVGENGDERRLWHDRYASGSFCH
jgi:hypothetical protein